MTEAASIRSLIAIKRDDIARLERRYGTGVRPSWVGSEIGILQAQINNLNAELMQCEN